MPQVIAGLYEVGDVIGSGGSGIVYLARHRRLNKLVVLKADKRTLAVKPEILRREVDALKNLSHTYIPQVHDFVAEGDTVYTVMDYIEGESLDKLLRRETSFSQAQVVEWACQLLEALCYLHSRPPYGILHGDIKPSNIMVTPEGDIRLIDFNIALAIGEEGAVKAGYSRGYASPEHYGSDFSDEDTVADSATDVMTEDETVVMSDHERASASSGYSSRPGMLDVRSDIYSLGATLYHLLSGERPAERAEDIIPLSNREFSPAVVAIIQKAMQSDPAKRFQSAEEMREAFLNLHRNDPSAKRFRLVRAGAIAFSIILSLTGAGVSQLGLHRMERQKANLVLAGQSESALRAGDPASAIAYALQAIPQEEGVWALPCPAEAQKALTDALGVYDLTDGFKSHAIAELPAEPYAVAISPDGKTAAAVCEGQTVIFSAENGELIQTLETEKTALAEAVFADDRTLIYAGDGALCAYDFVAGKPCWSAKAVTGLTVSGDKKTVAAVYKDESVGAVFDAKTGTALAAVPFRNRQQSKARNDIFANPQDNLFALNQNGTLLAASFADGSLTIFDLNDSEKDIELFEASDYYHFEGGFFGKYFAFSASGETESVFAVIDTELMEQVGGFASERIFHVQADENGIYLSSDNLAVQLQPETGEQQEIAYLNADIRDFYHDTGFTAATTDEKRCMFYDANANLITTMQMEQDIDFISMAQGTAVLGGRDHAALHILRYENGAGQAAGAYDPGYEHDEARLSADGSTVMLFRYDRFRLCKPDGTVIGDFEIPEPEQVHDQQFRRDENGSYLEVIYADGLIRAYRAVDGALLREERGEAPDPSLFEVFETDRWRIEAPLHGVPVVYDRASGEKLRELETEAYLTYVTQAGEYVVTEYVTADGDRYGLLLNEACEPIAELPGLCDIIDNQLVFDDWRGHLRKSHIYSLEELIDMGKAALESAPIEQEGGLD